MEDRAHKDAIIVDLRTEIHARVDALSDAALIKLWRFLHALTTPRRWPPAGPEGEPRVNGSRLEPFLQDNNATPRR
jgi:hypothetical protein